MNFINIAAKIFYTRLTKQIGYERKYGFFTSGKFKIQIEGSFSERY